VGLRLLGLVARLVLANWHEGGNTQSDTMLLSAFPDLLLWLSCCSLRRFIVRASWQGSLGPPNDNSEPIARGPGTRGAQQR
jgi:hypothetical protein